MASQQWGRKETVIFPPHSPIYTYGAVFLAFVLTGCFLYLRFTYGQTPLQQFYTPIYARTAAGAALNKKDKYQLLYVGDGTKAGALAAEADVQQGTTPAPGGKHIPLALSSAAAGRGLRALYRGPEQNTLINPCTSTSRAPSSRATSSGTSTNFRSCLASSRCSRSSRFPSERHQTPQADEVRTAAQRAGDAHAQGVQQDRAGRRYRLQNHRSQRDDADTADRPKRSTSNSWATPGPARPASSCRYSGRFKPG
jgi:hypothetical protein